ncbi:disease resistance protein RUN1 [Quercus suber]|uniref:disease resistance protein RUN1 n=1 Tax=Quercus suber TaxID=58331 RepID=UPI0032DF6177
MKDLVGIDSSVEELFASHLVLGNNVCMIGICGMGGLGKTTLARVIYEKFSNHFEGSSFFANVRERLEKRGLHELQQQLLDEILEGYNKSIPNVHEGVNLIKDRLRRKKVLLVLDDVNHMNQLEKLAGEHCWFGLGSWIIITTRDEHLLVQHKVNKICKPNVLNNDYALKLFCLKAFKNEQPKKGYEQLSQDFVFYAKGLPLALVVLGSFLVGRTKDEWESELKSIRKIPKREIFDILKISFDGLEEMWKEIFLDIACFFKGNTEDLVIKILENCGFNARIGISVLKDKSLISIENKILLMHDLLQDMGREIVRQKSCRVPGKQSRLCPSKDLFHVLTNNTATEEIQAMALNFEEYGRGHTNYEAFSKPLSIMCNLRLLIINEKQVHIANILHHVSNNLRHLSWDFCPLKCLPPNFEGKGLVGFNIQYGDIIYLWKGVKFLDNLKCIDLGYSEFLIETPDFTGVPRLKRLYLQHCINLFWIHPSIVKLRKLIVLNLENCKSLINLPSMTSEMESLTVLNLHGCSKFQKISEFKGTLKSLSILDLSETAIEILPSSIVCLTALTSFNLINCRNLVEIPYNIVQLSKLTALPLQNCESLINLPGITSEMESLTIINLHGCQKVKWILGFEGSLKSLSILDLSDTAIEILPSSIECLTALTSINLRNCKNLLCLPSNMDGLRSLEKVDLFGCSRLAKVPKNFWKISSLKELNLSGTFVPSPFNISETMEPIRTIFTGSYGLSIKKKLNRIGISRLKRTGFNNIGSLSSLKYLNLSGNSFSTLPASISQLLKLEALDLSECVHLQSLPELPLTVRYINAQRCYSLEPSPAQRRLLSLSQPCSDLNWYDEISHGVAFTILYRYLQELRHPKTGYKTSPKRKGDQSETEFQIIIPSKNIPPWLAHRSRGSSIRLELPPNWCNTSVHRHCTSEVFFKVTYGLGHIWLLYLSRDDWLAAIPNGDQCSQIEVVFGIKNSFLNAWECGVRLIYEQDVEEINQIIAQCSSSDTYEGSNFNYPHCV